MPELINQSSVAVQSKPPKKRSFLKFLLGCFVLLTVFCLGAMSSVGFLVFLIGSIVGSEGNKLNYSYVYGDKDSKNVILKINITGTILTENTEGSSIWSESGVVYGYEIRNALMLAADDKDIKGVILHIYSPGGTITGTRAIVDGIKYYKEKTNNPIIAYGQGLVASGGYWVASATDHIILDYGSTVGSIGVIFGPIVFYDQLIAEDGGILNGGVVTQNGIEYTYITAGQYKDIGSPYRKLTAEETAVLQNSVNNEYKMFVSDVSHNRNIPQETIVNQIKALIYDNETAISLKLVDESGFKEYAYRYVADKAKLGDDFEVDEYEDIGILSELFSASTFINKNSDTKVRYNWYSSVFLVYHGNPIESEIYIAN